MYRRTTVLWNEMAFDSSERYQDQVIKIGFAMWHHKNRLPLAMQPSEATYY